MLVRQVGRFCLRPSHLASAKWIRWTSNDKKYVVVEPDAEMENVAIVKMQKKPVNSLCFEHLQQLHTTFEELAEHKQYKAAILTSSIPGIYSAGLDLMSMYDRTSDEIYAFWTAFQKAWMSLYGSPLITAAAINGNSPAGGCLLALSCDYRVMADGKFGIGLNETQVGLVAPFWMKNTLLNVIGFKETERALQSGTLFTPSQAKEIGMVDEVTSKDQVLPSCRTFIKGYLKVPYKPRYQTKQLMRNDTIKKLTSKMHEDAELAAQFLSQDVVQKALEQYVQALAQKREK